MWLAIKANIIETRVSCYYFFFNFVVTGKLGRAFELVSRVIFVPNNWKVNKKLRPQTRKNTLRPQSYYCVRLMNNETTCTFLNFS